MKFQTTRDEVLYLSTIQDKFFLKTSFRQNLFTHLLITEKET